MLFGRHTALSSPHDDVVGESVRAELRPAAALFRSLGDPVRLTILRGLGDGEARVVDLTARLGLAQATVSAHLACLRDCGLVSVRAVGRASVYSLAQPSLLELFAAAEQVLAATGNAVALCPIYGDPQEQP
ncbi:ArsR/SmtB family transcription factor [Pseudonocardia sp. GCM10023141]|uniref:ArsR/SmtB family transcription factor n=1 Tax=Pseudonocardia sp. GCM10023141 TaxID=3252653 RepID=UPI003A96CBB4